MIEYESLPGYCKYISNDPKVIKGIFVDRKIRFTQPAALNDPMDCNPVLKVPSSEGEYTTYDVGGLEMPSINMWYHIQLVESHINEFGILSLTKNPISFDMWSKYANGHKGFVLELAGDFNLDPAFQSLENIPYEVRPIEYVDKQIIDLSQCLDAAGFLSLSKFEENLFFKKTRRWEKEKEYRLVRSLRDLGKPVGGLHKGIHRDPHTVYLGELPTSIINTITFGANMSCHEKQWVVDRCKGTKIQFLQCMINPLAQDDERMTPQIGLIQLDNKLLFKKVLNMEPQLLLMGNENLLGTKHKSLQEVEELPYYRGFEKLVNLMCENRKRHLYTKRTDG